MQSTTRVFSMRTLLLVMLGGTLVPAAMFAIWGGCYGYLKSPQVGDSQTVWFEPGIGTALFWAAVYPLAFCGVCFCSGVLNGMLYSGKTDASRVVRETLFWLLLVSFFCAFWQIQNFGHHLRMLFQ